MPANRFVPGVLFRWNEREYRVKERLLHQKLLLEGLHDHQPLVAEEHQLVEAFRRRSLTFLPTDYTPNSSTPSNGPRTRAWDDYSEVLRQEAEWRLWVISPLLEERSSEAILRRLAEVRRHLQAQGLHKPVSRTSIYEWLRLYEQGGRDKRTLLPDFHNRGGKGDSRLPPVVEQIVQSAVEEVLQTRESKTIDMVWEEVAARIEDENALRTGSAPLEIPSRSTIARRLRAVGLHQQFMIRHGKRAAEQEFTQYGDMTIPERPYALLEIDHTQVDLITVDAEDLLPVSRLTITSSLCVSTRYPGGIYIGFEPPGYLPVLECLYHTILPKGDVQSRYGTRHDWLSHGLPDNIHTDYAKEFVSPSLQDFCDSHNIHLRQIPGKRPHLRPFIERYYRTKNSGLFHTLPGTTFANYGKRGDYNSLKEACLTLQELEAILHKFLLDLYAEGYHRGLKGIPARRWEALSAQYPPRLPQSAEDLLIGLGRVTHRVVDKDGIDFETIRYNCDELAVLRHHLPKGQKVKIKFHPGDLSRIYLIHPFGEGALEVPALDQAYTQGLSLWQHNIIRRCERAARREVNPAERGRVRREIQTVVKAGKARSRQLRTRRAAARFEAVPPSLRDRYPEPDPSAPPALPVGQGAEDAVLDDATLQALQAEADEGWGLILPGSADVPGLFEQEETRHED